MVTNNPASKESIGLEEVVNLKVSLAETTNPGTGNDNTEGYSVGSRWINVSADKEFICLDVSTGAAVWTETTQSGGAGKQTFEISWAAGTSNGVDTTNGAYTVVATFIFAGTTSIGSPTSIKAICETDATTSADIRIQDVTNVQTIAELTGWTDASPAIKDLGTISNLPSGEAIWEVQIFRTGTGGQFARAYSLCVEF